MLLWPTLSEIIFRGMESNQNSRWIRNSCCVLFMYLTTGGALFGQGLNRGTSPNIEILRLHWEKQVRLPRNFDPSTIPTGTSFSDPASMSSVSAASVDEKVRSTARISTTNVFPSVPGQLPVYYVYSIKFKNSGKPIEGLAWDYLFLAPN